MVTSAPRRILKPEQAKIMQTAKNPQTPAPKLASFAKAPWNALPRVGHALRCAVALNPNTPVEALRLLSTKGYQRLVMRNPASVLLLVENPAVDLQTGPGAGFFTLARAKAAWEQSFCIKPVPRKFDLTVTQLAAFCQMAETMRVLCGQYFLPVRVASAAVVGPIETLRRRAPLKQGTDQVTQTTTVASWYGFLQRPLIDVARLRAARPVIAGVKTIPAEVSGRIDINLGAPVTAKPRLLEMLRREGYTPESPFLKKLGKGLAVYVSGKRGLESKYPTLYFKQTTGDAEQDKHLFEHFSDWHPV